MPAASPFFQIAGNIKQQFLPFVLVPSAKIHKVVGSSSDLAGAVSPQYFTYRDKEGDYTAGKAKLNFYPSSMNNVMLNDDISLKLLYARGDDGKPSNNSITLSKLLNDIPGVQIREFLPDTRLDQCINLFVDMMKGMKKLFSGEKDSSKEQPKDQKQPTDEEKTNKLFEKITAATKFTMKYMVGATDPDFFDDLALPSNLPFSGYSPDIYQSYKMFGRPQKSPGYFVMTFPYTLYYRLQSCVTTNIYEVPGTDSNKHILVSNGSAGWGGGDDILGSGEFRISSLLGKIPGIGNLANMILGNIGIHYMPWWNATGGVNVQEPEVEIKFDLFNDSYDAAMANFIFVNTIIPNNRWIQYNMFQHSSCLYDVKIEGINRLFACAGDFTVTYEGVLRDPPTKWLYDLINKHGNENLELDTFLTNAISYKTIKIPDVYRVSLKFKSLLPANFNNYIFSYAENASHIVKYKDKAYDPSAAAEALPNAMSKYTKRVLQVWESANEENYKI